MTKALFQASSALRVELGAVLEEFNADYVSP